MTGPRKRNAYAAPAWAAEQRFGKNGGVGLHATLLTLANYADENFSCYPSHGTVADETEQDERTVRRHIELCRELGLIVSERRHTSDGFRTSDRHYLQLDVVVVPEQVEAARLAIDKRNDERRAQRRSRLAVVGDQEDTVSDRTYRTPDAVLTDIARSAPNGHQMSEELLGELLEGTPRTKSAREKPTTEVAPKTPAKTAAGSRLDPNWIPPVELRQWALAECPGVDLKAEHAKFVDYWADLPGQRGRKVTWERTWRNWIRKAYADLRRTHRAGGGSSVATSTQRVMDLEALREHPRVGAQFEIGGVG